MEQNRRQAFLTQDFFSFTRTELLVKLILLFPITTLFQNHIGVLNKLLFFLVLAVLFCANAVRRGPFMYMAVISGLWLVSMAVTPLEALKLNLNMAFYYIFLVFYMIFVLTDQKKIWDILVKNRGYILAIVLFYTLVVAVSIFMPSAYQQSDAGGWGDEKYFVSISDSPNRVGPASVFVVVLITFLIKTGTHWSAAALSFPHLYVFLMGGSRTYFVVGACAMVVLFYVMLPQKRWFFLSLIPLGVVGMFLVLNSNMMAKFAATFQADQGLSQEEFWRRLTNTRSVFWVEQLKLFFATPWYKQLLGNGINFTTHQYGLWAHSDFIEILCSYGYIGLANYLGIMFYTMNNLLKSKRRHFFIKCVCIFIWFFNAFINFFYCYFCAMLCYPILLLIIKHMDEPKTPVSIAKQV